MKGIFYLTLTLLLSCFFSPLLAQEHNDFIKEYVERLENSHKYLMHLAETMLEDKYDFKASSESLSFAESLMHIGFAMNWHSQSLLGGFKTKNWKEDTVYKVANKSKKEMIAIVDQTFKSSIALIQKFDPLHLGDRLNYFGLSRTKRQIFMLLADHITHHRGQMLVYMRLNGLTPPRLCYINSLKGLN